MRVLELIMDLMVLIVIEFDCCCLDWSIVLIVSKGNRPISTDIPAVPPAIIDSMNMYYGYGYLLEYIIVNLLSRLEKLNLKSVLLLPVVFGIVDIIFN